MLKIPREVSSMQTGEDSAEPGHEFQAPELWETGFYLYKPLSRWYFVRAVQTDKGSN